MERSGSDELRTEPVHPAGALDVPAACDTQGLREHPSVDVDADFARDSGRHFTP